MDRFELEQQIQQCWNTKEDMDLLYQEVLEGESDFEKIANTLLGISALHDLRCKRLFETFEYLIDDQQII